MLKLLEGRQRHQAGNLVLIFECEPKRY